MADDVDFSIPYTPDRGAALRAVWDAATGGRLPLTAELWRERVDTHPAFEPDDCRIAAAPDGTVAGFVISRRIPPALVRVHPLLARDAGRGHILALAVHPAWQRRGIGRRLLAAAEARLHAQGVTRIVAWGPPGHLVPGPPVPEGNLPFWTAAGYVEREVAVDLRRDLADWVAPPPPPAVAAGAFAYRQGRPDEAPAILAFLRAAFPGSWSYHLTWAFARGYAPGDVTLLCDADEAIRGFCATFHPASGVLGGGSLYYGRMAVGQWGGLGPLGIAADVRGQGLGLGLVAAGVDYLYRRGVRDCGIDWTSLVAFYGRLGFTPSDRYWMLERPPADEP